MDLQLVRYVNLSKKHKVYFTLNGQPLVALYWEDINPIVYDGRYDMLLSQYTWGIQKNTQKAYCHTQSLFMHYLIVGQEKAKYINYVTRNLCDNRLENLRPRNSEEVHPDIKKLKIHQYPPYVHWHNGEFWIYGHPVLRNDRLCCSHEGTVYKKYLHACETLEKLDAAFEPRKKKLVEEYDEITDFVKLVVMLMA